MNADKIYRTARSGREWSQAQLKDYNIFINNVEAQSFFGQAIENVTLEEVPESILRYNTSNDILDDEDPGFDFLRFHDIVISGRQESTVDSLAQEILRIMKFRGSRRIILFHQRLPLTMCGTSTIAETDVCVQNNDNILLLIQEDKAYRNNDNPEAQLIAEAIAAFQYNNNIRQRYLRKAELQCYTFPCITMVGSYARFYKICITQELNSGIIDGYKPNHVTNVLCFDPLEKDAMKTFGMADLSNRRKILQCFKLMRKMMLDEAEKL